MMIVINVILFIVLILMAISTYVLYPDFKHYKKNYNNLKSMRFYKDEWRAYSNYDNTFIWFENNGGFMICPHVYISNDFVTYLSPYSLYWLIKYQRYMKNYIKNEIQ